MKNFIKVLNALFNYVEYDNLIKENLMLYLAE